MLGAGGLLGGAWLAGSLATMAEELHWDPASAELIVGTSAGSMIGALVAGGVPPWFMAAHSAGESFPGLLDARGRPTDEADRSAGGVLRPERLAPAPTRIGGPRPRLAAPARPAPARRGAGGLGARGRHVAGAAEGHRAHGRPVGLGRRRRGCGWWRSTTRRGDGSASVATTPRRPTWPTPWRHPARCPGLYEPQRIGGRTYVDGGAWSISNLDAVAREDLDLVICLNPMSSRPRSWPGPGKGPGDRGDAALDRATPGLGGAAAPRTGNAGGAAPGDGRGPEYMRGNVMSTARRHAVLEQARRSMREQLADTPLPDYFRDLPNAPDHRIRRPEGLPQDWPTGALPPGASVRVG